jgi:hypothetical protein
MTVGIDLSDPGSPCGNVHIRNKTAVAERMALVARAIAYGHDVRHTGPVAQTLTALSDHGDGDADGDGEGAAIEVAFSGGTPPLAFRTIAQTTNATDQGFELLYPATPGARSAIQRAFQRPGYQRPHRGDGWLVAYSNQAPWAAAATRRRASGWRPPPGWRQEARQCS